MSLSPWFSQRMGPTVRQNSLSLFVSLKLQTKSIIIHGKCIIYFIWIIYVEQTNAPIVTNMVVYYYLRYFTWEINKYHWIYIYRLFPNLFITWPITLAFIRWERGRSKTNLSVSSALHICNLHIYLLVLLPIRIKLGTQLFVLIHAETLKETKGQEKHESAMRQKTTA